MGNISKGIRAELAERYVLDWGAIVRDRMSADGTRKWLLDFGGQQVETVFIPEESRGTVCLSSQVGCTLSCAFCHTGTQKVVRNLKASEIVGQFLNTRKQLFDLPPQSIRKRTVSNIVFMGQGEPFYNYRNLSKALQVLMDPEGCEMSKRRITVSTSGVVPMIKRLGEDFPGIRLAISLHAPTDSLRDELVPINRQFKIAELMEACRQFPGLSWTHKITWEYVMLKGVNDSPADARELLRLIKDIPSLVNLIPFNSWPGTRFEVSSDDTILAFQKILHEANIDAPIRWPRGRDIMAACGQLRTASQKTSAVGAAATTSAPAATMSAKEMNDLLESFSP
jgi:23S rRNA (adenine2503-C2)-methyltransferase